jgi:hypothetical protein
LDVNLVDELHAVCAALVATGVRHAVCGGIAVTVHGATRSTKDIDILVHPDDLGRAMDCVRPLGFTFAALPMTFEEGPDVVVSRDTLLRMKRLAGRAQDLVDIEKLENPDAV